MNKNDYLNRLSRLLHMLQESEVKDILDEYEQHIDMKIAEGMTEEEAVAAFGTVEELAGEILDAYHVKADFKEKKKKEVLEKVQTESKKAIKSAGEAGKGFYDRGMDFVRKIGDGTGRCLKKCCRKVKNICLAPFLLLKRFFSKKEKEDLEPVRIEKEKTRWNVFGLIKSFVKGIFRFLKKICYGAIFICSAITELIMILVVGMLAVLLILGYPVIGVSIISLGIVMAVGVTAYYSGIKWRRR